MNGKLYDIVILGGGPSGLTAAIYASRAHLDTLVFAGDAPGGQLMLTTEVENFPGFPEGIMGPELMSNMRIQSERFGSEIIDKNAIKISGSLEKNFTVTTEDNMNYKARTVIVATGASARWLNLESEQRLRGKGVSACAVCDGFFFKDKIVAVVGGGDAAMEEATYLTKFSSKVYVLVRKGKDDLAASKIMQERAFSNPKVEFIFNTEVKEVLGDTAVSGLIITDNKSNKESELAVQGLFLAIGHSPNTEFLKGFLDLDEKNYIKVTDHTRSSVKGVFVSGDVYDFRYRQAITASGFGCMAALDAEKMLAELGHVTKSGSSW